MRDLLKHSKLLTDGSFGTYYSDKYATEEMAEYANLTHRDRVVEIHKAYIEAGASLIRTNTFASNTATFNEEWSVVAKNIKEAIQCGRDAIEASEVNRRIWLAGDIGPIPSNGFWDESDAKQEYCHIVDLFIDNGLAVIVFETMPSLEAIIPAIKRAKEKNAFVIVEFAINQFGYSTIGNSAKKLMADASKIDEIDAVGLNCGVGPAHMCQIVEKLSIPEDKFFVTLPNAGYPKLSRNQLTFGNTPAYFASKVQKLVDMGSDIIGGCCGTNPSFIRELADKVELTQRDRLQRANSGDKSEAPVIKKGFMYDESGRKKIKKFIAVELAPPFNADDEKILESAHYLMNHDVDVLTFPDSPSGRTRVDSVLMAGKVRRETGMAVMPHICCRDKNAVAMRSLFLGAEVNDIHDALIITGDPLPSMARQTVKAVFNFDSTGLMNILKEMNEDVFEKGLFSYGGAINQGRRNLEVEISRVKKKMECGAEFFLTQPVCCQDDVDRLRRIKEETGATILCGIMPFVSYRNALFMKNEISGVNVTDELIARYPENGTKEEGEAVGVALAKEMMEATTDFVDGYYFSFPFNRVNMLEKIVG